MGLKSLVCVFVSAMVFVTSAEILVSDAFPVGEGGYAREQKSLKDQSVGNNTGWEWNKWNNGGGSGVLYSFGAGSGLEFPAQMEKRGFASIGASVGLHGTGIGNPRIAERKFSCQLPTGSNKIYLRFLLHVDAACAAIISKPENESMRFTSTTSYAAGLSNDWNSDADKHDVLFKTARNLLFGVAKTLDDKLELVFCAIDSSGARHIKTLVPDTAFKSDATYLCLAEIDIDSGDEGKERIRAAAFECDTFTPNFTWAMMGEEDECLEAEVWSAEDYPDYFGFGGRYQNNGGYFKVDEIVLATELSDVVFYDAAFPRVDSCFAGVTHEGAFVSAVSACEISDLFVRIDDGAGVTVEKLIAEDVPAGEFRTLLLTELASDRTHTFTVLSRNEFGEAEMSAGVVYTGVPKLSLIANADENGLVNGVFSVSRADTANDLTIFYVCSGTAIEGVNYRPMPGIVTIPAGQSTAMIPVQPLFGAPFDTPTELTLTLVAGRYCLAESPQTATLTIANEALPVGTNTWVAASAGSASESSNWSLGRVPTATDEILLDGKYSSANLLWDAANTEVPDTVKSWTQEAGYTGRVELPTTRTGDFTCFTVTGDAVLNGGEWWRPANLKDDGNDAKVWLNISVRGDLTVGSEFTFNGEACGFPKQKGPSPGGEKGSSGGAHGGLGGGGTYGNGKVYGDYRNPTELGSGQYGSTFGGGGAIILDVSGDFSLEGCVNANAGDSGTGSGQSGGSVWIKARTLSGINGLITADGGSPSNKRAGGGAGRISIQLSEPTWSQTKLFERFTGKISAIGGFDTKGGDYARVPGASGTVYIETAADDGKGTMRLFNGNWSNQKPHNAVTLVADGVKWDVSQLTMGDNGRVGVSSGGEVHVPSFASITGDNSQYCLLAFIGGTVSSDIKHDKLIADGFDVENIGTSSFAEHTLVIPDESSLKIGGDFTVGALIMGRTRIAAGDYPAAELGAVYGNVSGDGVVHVLGLTDGFAVTVR